MVARETLLTQIAIYDALWDSMFLFLLIGFLIGNVLYGIATVHGHGLTRIISWFYFAAAFLTLTILSGELHGNAPRDHERVVVSAVQPAARFLIGVWLWRGGNADREPSGSGQLS